MRTEAYTWPMTAFVGGIAIGAALAGVLVEGPGWRTAFVVAGGDRRRRLRCSRVARRRTLSGRHLPFEFVPYVSPWPIRSLASLRRSASGSAGRSRSRRAAQAQAWPAIATGEHVLISAPTGSGKTLAAFLWGLDRFVAQPTHEQTRLVYVSPLKALVVRRREEPARAAARDRRRAERRDPHRRHAAEGAARHGQAPARRADHHAGVAVPDADLPGAREIFEGTETVILDEIHAVAQTKRGAHLAMTLERLVEQAGRDVQRVGLSRDAEPAGGGRPLHGRPDAARARWSTPACASRWT